MKDIINGIKHIHSLGFMHRDIKPANIMVKKDGTKIPTLKIADLGMAISYTIPDTELSQAGTPLYMAPELFRKEKYNSSVDIWSVGVIFYGIYIIFNKKRC